MSSIPVQVDVTYNCSFQNVFPNLQAPSLQEIKDQRIPNEVKFISYPSHGKSHLLFNASVGSYRQVSFGFSRRISSNATEYCNSNKYSIRKVVDLKTNKEIDQTIAKLFV